jgi:hypothetical protein
LVNRKLVFESLNKKALVEIASRYDMRGMVVLTKDQLVEKLYRNRSVDLMDSLKGFSRNGFKKLCIKLGPPHNKQEYKCS